MDDFMQTIFTLNSNTEILRNMEQIKNLTITLEKSVDQIVAALGELEDDVILKTSSMTGRKILPDSGPGFKSS